MAELYETLKASLANERPVALATLVGGAGALGAKLLVFQDGTTQGTLGSEKFDARVAVDARPMIWQSYAKTITYQPEADDPTLTQPAEVFIEAFPPPHK